MEKKINEVSRYKEEISIWYGQWIEASVPAG